LYLQGFSGSGGLVSFLIPSGLLFVFTKDCISFNACCFPSGVNGKALLILP
jgi:hypothetical protein